jgi:hypothetical protein
MAAPALRAAWSGTAWSTSSGCWCIQSRSAAPGTVRRSRPAAGLHAGQRHRVRWRRGRARLPTGVIPGAGAATAATSHPAGSSSAGPARRDDRRCGAGQAPQSLRPLDRAISGESRITSASPVSCSRGRRSRNPRTAARPLDWRSGCRGVLKSGCRKVRNGQHAVSTDAHRSRPAAAV